MQTPFLEALSPLDGQIKSSFQALKKPTELENFQSSVRKYALSIRKFPRSKICPLKIFICVCFGQLISNFKMFIDKKHVSNQI